MLAFPHPYLADEDGLLAYGGDLSPERLVLAYQSGIFPWYQEDPILWWFTHPRCVLYPEDFKLSKSMRSYVNQKKFKLSINQHFDEVIHACRSQKRHGQLGTWLNDDMVDAYAWLHRLGIAHSVEVWNDNLLVGGLYGVLLGRIFYGESMFALQSNASKYGFYYLVKILSSKGVELIDCQQDTAHLRSLGTRLISREVFLAVLKQNTLADHLTLHDHDVPEELRHFTTDVLL